DRVRSRHRGETRRAQAAALRDFDPAYDRCGSIATDEVEVTRSRMSASPLKADNLHTISASPLSARSGCEQLQQSNPLFNHFVSQREQFVRNLDTERLRSL